MGLDLPDGGEGLFELGPHFEASGDLLTEDFAAVDAVRFQGLQLGLEFLTEAGAAGVADADVGCGSIKVDGGAGGGVPGRQGWPGDPGSTWHRGQE
ncbi:hypothetical protein [Nonomuraea jabiensis]|uniref:Uncharacterized protein n=1 Tax=Nonomuraea jabiensis TaxID=882448 RepID=A0A7W9LFV7_9ACTN|nr:hypothetical protein [Nonomuraea jabiensis]MBB5782276.1 hypothetical protein [Nonomuraea jabiensis]